MKVSYSKNLTIDRINVNGNYTKENGRWATRKEQSSNKRDTIRFNWKCLKENCTELWLIYNTVFNRVHTLWWSIEDALELT